MNLIDWFMIVFTISIFVFSSRNWLNDLLARRGIIPLPDSFQDLQRSYCHVDTIDVKLLNGITVGMPRGYTVARKEALAEGLWRYAQGIKINRRALANNATDESFVVTLMMLIVNKPQKGDAHLIMEVSKLQVPPHTDYKTLDAIESLRGDFSLSLVEYEELRNALVNIQKRLPEAKDRILRLGRPVWKNYEENMDSIEDDEPVLSDEEVDNKKELVGATLWGAILGR